MQKIVLTITKTGDGYAMSAARKQVKMKQPLYALEVAQDPKMREDIVSGRKTIIIREGHRDYRSGHPVILCCYIEPWAVMADITQVRRCRLYQVAREELEADGFKSKLDLLWGLQKYYPDVGFSSPVTVIRWQNVRGKLVDDYREAPREK